MMKYSALEKDASFILSSMKEGKVCTVSNRGVMKFIFNWLKYVYFLQVIFIFLAYVIYNDLDYISYHYYKIVYLALISLVSVIYFTFAFVVLLYDAVAFYLFLDEEIRGQSLLVKLVKSKIKLHTGILFILNILIGAALLVAGEPFVAGLGFSWCATFIVSVIFLHRSLSPFMTPAVVSSLSEVQEKLSVSID